MQCTRWHKSIPSGRSVRAIWRTGSLGNLGHVNSQVIRQPCMGRNLPRGFQSVISHESGAMIGRRFGSATSISLEKTSLRVRLRVRTCRPRCADDCHTLPLLGGYCKVWKRLRCVLGTSMRPRWKSNQQSSILPRMIVIGPPQSVRE